MFLFQLWFESLPPVVIFSLVRFSYKNGQTEKVHSQFQFPRVIYMDRYLYRNRTFVSEKRIERKSLKKRLAHVKCELEGFVSLINRARSSFLALTIRCFRLLLLASEVT